MSPWERKVAASLMMKEEARIVPLPEIHHPKTIGADLEEGLLGELGSLGKRRHLV